ncbi:MAG TPA: RDD family protein, partial [Rhodanobacteraceae bacterium]|nr:RDD family protein [Rhodanobacteraceae bacterium]
AYLIDGIILVPAFIVLEFVLAIPLAVANASSHGRVDAAPAFGWMAFVWLLMIVGPWLYFALCESSRLQATPGKLALGLRVTDLYGRRIGFGKATGRYFGKLLSGFILNIGYMMAGWTAHKQALHDLMANCCVVRRDALAAFGRGDLDHPVAQVTRMPGWAVALIVLGSIFVVVVPIVAILAAIAIPAYQAYVIRAQVAQGMALAEGAKTAVAAYMLQHDGRLPADNAAAGFNAPDFPGSQYVTRVEVQQGNVVVTFGNRANARINDHHIVLQPVEESGYVRWGCGSDDIDGKFLPLACRAGGDGSSSVEP